MKLLIVIFFLVAQSIELDIKDPENPRQYIVGGNDASPGQFPYFVSLRKTSDRQNFCGGAIVNVRWVLTVS